MGILKYISFFLLVFFSSCINTEYKKIDDSFSDIHIKEWNSSICPKKVVFERYVKKTNFKKLIDRNTNFEIGGCEKTESKFNQRVFTPIIPYEGHINYDIKLIIDDSLEFKITNIQDKLDTISGKSGPGKWLVMNNIKSLIINSHKLDNTKTPLSFNIPTKIGKIIKK
ncbi:hypothetical protein OIU80_06620 [Flavobacterium sp. LS1R47]|uniref:Lipoprotein n=1 Tax=Flavobacterium frigoritolerans TaxID=2987686 RepID=A0A9X2ZIC3_9FLAO|nr:hypothetical protein [Flavobacterium frigoritolerans]MCV9931951.1 hypothetical protein [Flavobacterium frigoritolerans]